mgnify:FL=1
MSEVTVIAEGLQFPEGPVAMPDGSVILVEIAGGRLTRVHPDGRKEVVAEVGGAPNGAALGPDGRMWLCNNGGTQARGYIQAVDLNTGAFETVYTHVDE